MYILRYYFLLVFGFCAIAFAWGENIQSMEADFEQLIENEGGIDMFYKGKIFGKSPNKAKWEYQMPLKKEIYMNNGEVMIYEPALEQVSHSRLRTKSDFISIMKSAIKQADGSYRTSVDNVEYTLYVDKNDKPKSISFVDSMGSKSVLKFSNVKLNGTLNDKLFVFKVPEGVEVVEIKSR